MRPTITAFAASPDRGQGLARDMPVRWVFEEVGLPYDVRLLTFEDIKAPAHRALQPFGQIPTCQAGDLSLFESAAIVLHIAEQHAGLLPVAAPERARATSWLFAAVATVEPVIVERETMAFMEGGKPWYAERLALVEQRIHARLADLAAHLGPNTWLGGDFSAGDLLMVQVLRRLGGTALLLAFPTLCDYVARAESRPAFQRAFAAQLAVFTRKVGGAPAH